MKVQLLPLPNNDKIEFVPIVNLPKDDNVKEDTLHISPSNLDNLSYAIGDFIKEIPGKKFLIIDALSTLLIYNPENKVATFVKEVLLSLCCH